MDAEQIESMDSYAPTGNPLEGLQSESNEHYQEPGSKVVTWTFTCTGVKVGPKAYERLKSEIAWTQIADDSCMVFKSTDADAIDAFSKKLTKIISEGGEKSTTKAFTFTLTPEDR